MILSIRPTLPYQCTFGLQLHDYHIIFKDHAYAPMKPFQRQQRGIEQRTLKYAEFQAFFDGAEGLFSTYAKRDFGDSASSGIVIKSGGRFGGNDKRLIEIFFSSKPYDVIANEDKGLALKSSLEGPTQLSESGPCLVYQRADTGYVFCILQPAKTDESKTDEDMVILQTVRNPCTLNRLAHSHWQDLLAYRECTSINGAPSIIQRIRCAYLRHFRKLGKDHKYQPAKVPRWINQLAVLTSGFVLGGFITTTIEKRFFPDSIQAPKDTCGVKTSGGISDGKSLLSPKHIPKTPAHKNTLVKP